jgi:hypothetical protein
MFFQVISVSEVHDDSPLKSIRRVNSFGENVGTGLTDQYVRGDPSGWKVIGQETRVSFLQSNADARLLRQGGGCDPITFSHRASIFPSSQLETTIPHPFWDIGRISDFGLREGREMIKANISKIGNFILSEYNSPRFSTKSLMAVGEHRTTMTWPKT